jgi:hypothetical protein
MQTYSRKDPAARELEACRRPGFSESRARRKPVPSPPFLSRRFWRRAAAGFCFKRLLRRAALIERTRDDVDGALCSIDLHPSEKRTNLAWRARARPRRFLPRPYPRTPVAAQTVLRARASARTALRPAPTDWHRPPSVQPPLLHSHALREHSPWQPSHTSPPPRPVESPPGFPVTLASKSGVLFRTWSHP